MFVLLIVGLGATASERGHPSHWSYEGKDGPDHWGAIEPGYVACGMGRNQSPIDLGHFIEADLPPIAFDYKPGGAALVNNGHAVQVDYLPGSSITVDGTRFELKQFHFHAPSEHTIGGKSYPMEVHFVHADAHGDLAVVGVMVEQGAENPVLEALDARLPPRAGEKASLAPAVAAIDLLPDDRDYYRYSGSLTTPPCSEGVRWLVLKHAIGATPAQIGPIAKAIGHAQSPHSPGGRQACARVAADLADAQRLSMRATLPARS